MKNEEKELTGYDPCAKCTIRDWWCCDPWENHFDHQDEF